MGTRDLRMALILRASPLPAWINCGPQTIITSDASLTHHTSPRCLYSLYSTYMHLWSTTAQQVNECRVERHDGIAQMHPILFQLFTTKPDNTQTLIWLQ